ncbi:MAG TPA: hypothetical protein DCZ10_14790 [Pelotomaculum sp.]|nr:hypothetical protein [Pelotomaculum sp.]
MNTIGQRIKYLREKLNRTQQEVADQTRVSRGNISNYEKDRVSPAADTIIALCEYFDVSCDWLLTGRERGAKETNVESLIDTLENKAAYLKVSEEEEQIIRMYRDFSSEDKEFLKNMIYFKHSQIKKDMKKQNA